MSSDRMLVADAAIARYALSRGWVTDLQLKDALYEQLIDPTATVGRERPRTLLEVLLTKGWISPSQREELVGHVTSPSASSGEAHASIYVPPPEAIIASQDPRNCTGSLIKVTCVGQGGMGTVWKAWDTNLRRWVAVKYVAAAQRHLLKEARLGAKLDHPNIVPIYHLGGEESGEPYIAMKYVDGGTLLDRIGALSSKTSAAILLEVALAIQYAHDHGVIHRDLKPRNILMEPDGRPVVTDFGLARELAVGEGGAAGVIVGTPAYIAPEVAEGGASGSPAVDVYGLGATLYHLVTGQIPYEGSSAEEILERVRHDPPPLPRSVNPLLSPDMERIILRAMERDVARRYPSVADFAKDLERFLRNEPILDLGEERFVETVALIQKGDLLQAVRVLREAVRLGRSAANPDEPWTRMLDKIDEDESTITLALSAQPGYAVGLRYRAGLRLTRALVLGLRSGRPEVRNFTEAVEDARQAGGIDPAEPLIGMIRANIHMVRARFSRILGISSQWELQCSIDAFEDVIRKASSPAAYRMKAISCLLLGQFLRRRSMEGERLFGEAIRAMQRACMMQPDDGENLHYLVLLRKRYLAGRLGADTAAFEALENALKTSAESLTKIRQAPAGIRAAPTRPSAPSVSGSSPLEALPPQPEWVSISETPANPQGPIPSFMVSAPPLSAPPVSAPPVSQGGIAFSPPAAVPAPVPAPPISSRHKLLLQRANEIRVKRIAIVLILVFLAAILTAGYLTRDHRGRHIWMLLGHKIGLVDLRNR